MKAYIPEKLVAISRYKTLFPTLPSEIQGYARRSILRLWTQETERINR